MAVIIPNRFESLYSSYQDKLLSLLIQPTHDLERFQRIALEIRGSGTGKIVFLQGKPGAGKSTFAYCLPNYLPNFYHEQIRVPSKTYELKMKDIPEYIQQKVTHTEKISVVTIDNRESPQHEGENLQDLFSDFKSILRENRNILIIWPVVTTDFANKAISTMEQIGGNSALAYEPLIAFQGIDKGEYQLVLERLLRIQHADISDYGISSTELKDIQDKGLTIGEFLNSVNQLIVRRIQLEPPSFGFDKLIFVVSSSAEGLLNTARELRRGDTFYLESSRLLMNTPSSNIREWWDIRNKDPKTSLAYIINLFQAELVTLTPTSVVHSCNQYGETDLRNMTLSITPNASNAKRSIQSSELYKALASIGDNSNRKGTNPSDEVIEAYNLVQAASEKRHKSINEAIMKLLQQAEPNLLTNVRFEQSYSGLIIDVIAESNEKTYNLEFHHKSDEQYNPNKVTLYVLEKLKEYAINYGIASR